MVIMDSCYVRDKLLEVWHKIRECHLSYLSLDESPAKFDKRSELEEYIKQFLCMAPHDQKFLCHETADVLQRSATSKSDFSGYKAATGWNAIQLYAGNLLFQPWRKEYRTIKTYCGFYKHQIEANLLGAERMFEAMGYKHVGNGILELDGPICPDAITNVSQDCLIAYVECQILKTIWEGVATISWLDVFEFRKLHICSPDEAIRVLKYRQHERHHNAQHTRALSQGADSFMRCSATQIPVNNSFPPFNHLHGIPPVPVAPAVPLPYCNGYCNTFYPPQCYYDYSTPPPPPPPAVPYALKPPHFNTNGYYYSNGYPPPLYQVPTGQLIELEPNNHVTGNQLLKSDLSSYDEVDYSKQTNGRAEKAVSNNNNNNSVMGDWEYVYKNLESQGYSKDLGERGDLLSPTSKSRKSNVKTTNLDEAMHNLVVSERPLKVSEALEKFDSKNDRKKLDKSIERERRNSQSSSYENLTAAEAKSMKSKKSNVSAAKLKEKTIEKHTAKENINSWQCVHCTYINTKSKDICEICSKSRNKTVDEPMEVGGPECSKCTLVNPKHLKVCQACNTSLENSPTYI